MIGICLKDATFTRRILLLEKVLAYRAQDPLVFYTSAFIGEIKGNMKYNNFCTQWERNEVSKIELKHISVLFLHYLDLPFLWNVSPAYWYRIFYIYRPSNQKPLHEFSWLRDCKILTLLDLKRWFVLEIFIM